MTNPEIFYQERVVTFEKKLAVLRRRSLLIETIRLAAFLLAAFILYRLVVQFNWLLGAAFVGSLIVFVSLVRYSVNLNTSKALLTRLVFLCNNERSVLANGINGFPESPPSSVHALYGADLDIFGPRSLFHLLNRTTTQDGASTLAGFLDHPTTNIDEIRAYQEAIRAFSPQADTRQTIIANGLFEEEKAGRIEELSEWIKGRARFSTSRLMQAIRFVLPLYNLAAFIYLLDTKNLLPLTAGFAAGWVISLSQGSYISSQQMLTGKKDAILQQYAAILRLFATTDPRDSDLLDMWRVSANNAHREILKLSKLVSLLDQRLNLVVSIFLNGFLLYDIHCMIALEKWKQRNAGRFSEWVFTVGQIEALNSFATFAFNNPLYCYPEFEKGRPFIAAKNMAHPLIPYGEQVANDADLGTEEKLLLVTGSNMSGKSTFLRTLGVNLLLAQCGAPVCATEFRCGPVIILSSIRITDSLQDHTSYFMAELQRLKLIVETLEEKSPALVLIDEVLRGTNSEDKSHGSAAFINKLLQYDCLTVFATHDLNLSVLEKTFPGQVSNYCFESVIRQGELSFDYKLRRGVATNKNASFLMQRMGII